MIALELGIIMMFKMLNCDHHPSNWQ